MTRQQEGDEAMVKAVYPDAYINDDYSGSPSSDVGVFRKATKEDWPKNREIPISEFFATAVEAWADARSKLPATVHPEDETTLPALNVKCACGVTIEAVRSVHSPDECVNMDHYVLRISAEAERDALKAELLLHVNRTLRNAVVGQETAAEAYWRGVQTAVAVSAHVAESLIDSISPEVPIDCDNGAAQLGWDQACKDIARDIKAVEFEPYTPPLKAGQ